MAAQKQKIFMTCPYCDGAKQVKPRDWIPDPENPDEPPPLIDCPRCLGEGHIEWGYLLVPTP